MDATTSGPTPDGGSRWPDGKHPSASPRAPPAPIAPGPAVEERDGVAAPSRKGWKLKVAVILLVILISIAFAGLVWSMIL